MSREFSRSVVAMILVVLAMAGVAATAHAQGATTSQEDEWRYAVGIYGWMLSVDGDLKSPDGTDHNFNIPLSEILSGLDAYLGAVGEVGYGKWFLGFDGMWATLSGDYVGTVFDLDVVYKQQIYDIHAGYGVYRHVRAVDSEPGKKPWARFSAVDVLLGARYFGTKTTLTETTHLTGRVHTTEIDASRWDPIIGARGSQSLSNRWLIYLRADIGGFGIGDASDFAYEVDANINYRISHPLSVYAGYRVLGYDLGSDNGGDTTITQHGPKVGATLVF